MFLFLFVVVSRTDGWYYLFTSLSLPLAMDSSCIDYGWPKVRSGFLLDVTEKSRANFLANPMLPQSTNV